jgi:hypothetical protein
LFSGSKGFHLYLFFNPTLFNYESFNSVAYGIFKGFKDKLKLETLDGAVFFFFCQRISRLPYFKHPITELYCYPIDINDTYTTIIEQSFKPRINELKISEYVDNQANQYLLNDIKELIKSENHKQLELKKLEVERKELHKKAQLKKYNQFKKTNYKFKELEKDCIRIANEFLGSPSATYGSYVTYICPFHNDNKPSLSVYKERFYCAVCDYKLNYLDFIMKYHGVDDKEAIKILLNTF